MRRRSGRGTRRRPGPKTPKLTRSGYGPPPQTQGAERTGRSDREPDRTGGEGPIDTVRSGGAFVRAVSLRRRKRDGTLRRRRVDRAAGAVAYDDHAGHPDMPRAHERVHAGLGELVRRFDVPLQRVIAPPDPVRAEHRVRGLVEVRERDRVTRLRAKDRRGETELLDLDLRSGLVGDRAATAATTARTGDTRHERESGYHAEHERQGHRSAGRARSHGQPPSSVPRR